MAKTKKAPVVRNVINNNIPNTYRAINRMNGIVTMIEYTGEDDIKAYELEPTYREIGGGGGAQYVIGKQTVTLSTDPVTLTDVADDLLDYEYIAVVVTALGTEEVVISKRADGHNVYYDFTLFDDGGGGLSYRIDTTNMTLYSTTSDAPSLSGAEIWACPVYM